MKRYLILLLTVVTVITACKKEKNEEANPIGNWELRHVDGDSGIHDYKPGNGNILQFTKTNIKSYAEGKLIFDHPYSVVKKDPLKVTNTDEASYQLIWDIATASERPYFKIANGKLTLYYGLQVSDGAIITYEKQ